MGDTVYSWALEAFPIEPGTEITWRHFETIRRAIYLYMFPNAGAEASVAEWAPSNYLTPSTWGAFCESFISYGVPSPWPMSIAGRPAHPSGTAYQFFSLIRVHYLDPETGEEESDVFSVKKDAVFLSLEHMQANPPIKDGKLNDEFWRYQANINRYHDFDYNSGRWITIMYSRPGSMPPYFYEAPAWRYLPKQVDPRRQKPRIKYEDTGRIIINRTLSPELNWQHITQPSTMGPLIDLWYVWKYEHSRAYFTKNGVETAASQPVGYDYAWPWSYSEAPDDEGEGASDAMPDYGVHPDQRYADEKYCAAYQNMVEQVVSMVSRWVPINNDADYIRNWNAHHSEQNQFNQDLHGNAFVYNGDAWLGCNGSAFELALKRLRSPFWLGFDWWIDTSHVYRPNVWYAARAENERTGGPNQPSGVVLPDVPRTWRRTWRYSFGRPKNCQYMAPGLYIPARDDYNEFQPDDDGGDPPQYNMFKPLVADWPSIFTHPDTLIPSAPGSWPQEVEDALRHRHDPQLILSGRAAYEQHSKNILNDMFKMLVDPGMVEAAYTDVQIQSRDVSIFENNIVSNSPEHAQTIIMSKIQEAYDEIESKPWTGGLNDAHDFINVSATAVTQLIDGQLVKLHDLLNIGVNVQQVRIFVKLSTTSNRTFHDNICVVINFIPQVQSAFKAWPQEDPQAADHTLASIDYEFEKFPFFPGSMPELEGGEVIDDEFFTGITPAIPYFNSESWHPDYPVTWDHRFKFWGGEYQVMQGFHFPSTAGRPIFVGGSVSAGPHVPADHKEFTPEPKPFPEHEAMKVESEYHPDINPFAPWRSRTRYLRRYAKFDLASVSPKRILQQLSMHAPPGVFASRPRQFTEIAEDDGKFDAQGNLLPASEWPQ